VGLLAPLVPFSADDLSSSVQAALRAIRSVPVRRQVHPAFQLDVGPCILRVLRPVAHQADAPASANAPAARAAVPASARVPEWEQVEAWYRLQAKRRVHSVRAVRHAAVDVSSTPRPKKAR
jgi:hypothetical protein